MWFAQEQSFEDQHRLLVARGQGRQGYNGDKAQTSTLGDFMLTSALGVGLEEGEEVGVASVEVPLGTCRESSV